jgi:hypothetical protein
VAKTKKPAPQRAGTRNQKRALDRSGRAAREMSALAKIDELRTSDPAGYASALKLLGELLSRTRARRKVEP